MNDHESLQNTAVLGFSDYQQQGERLAAQLGIPYQSVEIHRFPDGESRVRLMDPPMHHLVVCRSLDRPHDKLIELLLAARTSRELGVKQLTLVCPYLCYMRQDKAFESGEAVSQRIIGQFLSQLFDAIITVDPHLHRTSVLKDAVPAHQALAISSAPLMGEFLKKTAHSPLLLGPDVESAQWVKAIAGIGALEYGIAQKQRLGDRHVNIELPDMNYHGRQVVLVDDVVSTGHTVAETAHKLKTAGASEVCCLTTHALFAPGAEEELRTGGIDRIWSSDSISHPSNILHLDRLLADAVLSTSFRHA